MFQSALSLPPKHDKRESRAPFVIIETGQSNRSHSVFATLFLPYIPTAESFN
jgi:hypothetical protein